MDSFPVWFFKATELESQITEHALLIRAAVALNLEGKGKVKAKRESSKRAG